MAFIGQPRSWQTFSVFHPLSWVTTFKNQRLPINKSSVQQNPSIFGHRYRLPWTTNEHQKDTGYVCPAKGSQHSSWHSGNAQLLSTSACDILQVSWCVFRQPPQLGGSDLAHHQESLAKDWGLVTRWSATDVTCQTIILLGHHCCRHRIWFERLLFVSFHLFEGKTYSPLQAWCPSNF